MIVTGYHCRLMVCWLMTEVNLCIVRKGGCWRMIMGKEMIWLDGLWNLLIDNWGVVSESACSRNRWFVFFLLFLVKISLRLPINVSRQSNDDTGQWFVCPFEKLWLRWSLRTNCYVYGLYFFTWWYLGMLFRYVCVYRYVDIRDSFLLEEIGKNVGCDGRLRWLEYKSN